VDYQTSSLSPMMVNYAGMPFAFEAWVGNYCRTTIKNHH
jgi:hypothetical protein